MISMLVIKIYLLERNPKILALLKMFTIVFVSKLTATFLLGLQRTEIAPPQPWFHRL
jgi:hypothetical protein